ncbi:MULTISPECIES: hypothetical protein [Bacteroidales]|jgi:hypothetical protein|uniref:Uncharacterized protein n=1 Tax=bioreactor metagenome TaxID=1076179 RepID=A0A644WGT1_9ZZZZ|nr:MULTISPECIES: hypothetical protein [Bacteroidales]MDL2215061.1 hypothetical protein [Dysgonomonas sp. OttesenSCG-928-M03]OJV82672.1 MAG: hypothetical protein BGO34_17255 [Bacteroidia bacterium 44-10]MCL3851037.1 hypothetical protein [Parabacteroides leei]MDC2615386.1 hypothetical protein [Bacteroides ovatus]MDC2634660.1 hypothetical protein [Bacteroides ovatus]
MKLKVNKTNKTCTISGLTSTEVDVILGIVDTANRRCFREQEDSGEWYSNDDFVLSLTDEQRQALSKIGEEIQQIYNS